jgi:hypothetical protein
MAKVEVPNFQKLGQMKTSIDVSHLTAFSFLTDLAKVFEGRGKLPCFPHFFANQ